MDEILFFISYKEVQTDHGINKTGAQTDHCVRCHILHYG